MNARIAKARAHAAENRITLLAEVNRTLAGLGSPLTADISEFGHLVLQDQVTGERLMDEVASFELLGRGSMVQSPRAHLKNLVEHYPNSLEARLINTVAGTLPAGVYVRPTRSDAAKVIGALIRPLWALAQDPEVTQQAHLAAKASPGVRINASRLLGAAGEQGGNGARFGAEGFLAAPIVAALSTDPSATGRELGRGGSIKKLVRRLGGGPNVAALSPGVVSRINSLNVDWAEEALGELRSSGITIPTKVPQQRRVVAEILAVQPLLAAGTPAGFIAWNLRERCKRVLDGHKAEIASVADMARWARITAGEPGGWHPKMRFDRAVIASYELMTADPDGAPPDEPLRQQFAAYKTDDDWLVRAADSVAEIHGWGAQLNVCLQVGRILADTAANIKKGSIHIVGVFKLGAGLKPKLVAIAELTTRGLVIQHRARANQNPPAGAEKALTAAINLNYHGDRA